MDKKVVYNKCVHNKTFEENCIECKPNSDNINSKLEDDKQDEWRIVMSEKID